MATRLLQLFLIAVFSSGCVSVSLGPKPAERSKAFRFQSPGGDFKEVKIEDMDRTWRSTSTGNTISIKTSCDEAGDPSLTYLRGLLFEGIDQLKITLNELTTYNGREALHSIAQGRIDGIETGIELMIFKKNNCSYTLSYIGVKDRFEKDRSTFQNFLNGFGVE